MSTAKEPDTDHGSLESLSGKYTALKASMPTGSGLKETSSPSTQTQRKTPPAPGKSAASPPKTNRYKKRAAPVQPSRDCDAGRSVEDLIQIEKNQLVTWLTKFAAITSVLVVGGFLAIFAYVTYSTQALPTESVLIAFFEGFKEIVLIILGAGQ